MIARFIIDLHALESLAAVMAAMIANRNMIAVTDSAIEPVREPT